MAITDALGDMLTVVRNGLMVGFDSVQTPFSSLKEAVLKVLKEEGYIVDYRVEKEGIKSSLVVQLKYGPNGEDIINEIRRVSKPGRRIYKRKREIPKIKNGLGISIFSTPKGVMTGQRARMANVGGEFLCEVY